MSETPTPRTDAEAVNKHVIRSNGRAECHPYVCAFFARTLERELAQARAELARKHEMYRECLQVCADAEDETERLTIELAAAERRVERLREELWNIVNANPRQWGDQADQFEAWAKNRARAALAETKEGASNE